MKDTSKIFKAILNEHIDFNTKNECHKSETAICRRLLTRETELVDAYNELSIKLNYCEFSLKVFIDGLLGAAAVWNPAKMADARQKRDRLEEVNQKIADTAFALAKLLQERSSLNNHSGFASETHYHILMVIEEAARSNAHFELYIKSEIKALRGQFDFKYWPPIEDIVRVLALDAKNAVTYTHNALTAAGTSSSRASRADFFRAWFKRIEEDCHDHLPYNFRLSDASYASFATCALDIAPEEMVTAEYVKRLRQRNRDANQNDGS